METTNERPTKNEKAINVGFSRWKRKILSHVLAVRVVIIILVVGLLISVALLIRNIWVKYDASLYLNVIHNFLSAPTSQLPSSSGRTNILVMGKAGGVHDGPDLTDTMMIISVSLKSQNVKIISIPRDTWIPEIRAKINSAYYWGNKKEVGGINLAKALSSVVIGVPVQYAAVIDFSGFKDIINELGGVQVDVANDFTDYYYPIAGKENDTCGGHDPQFMCRYETLSFVKGVQKMDGETALKFVRSRHADGIEGTDIAREARQQKVIDALKNKLSNKDTYTDLKKDKAIVDVILRSVETDIDYPSAAILVRRFYDSRNDIHSYVIPGDLLINPPISDKYDLQSVFIPKLGNGKWNDINHWASDILK